MTSMVDMIVAIASGTIKNTTIRANKGIKAISMFSMWLISATTVLIFRIMFVTSF